MSSRTRELAQGPLEKKANFRASSQVTGEDSVVSRLWQDQNKAQQECRVCYLLLALGSDGWDVEV